MLSEEGFEQHVEPPCSRPVGFSSFLVPSCAGLTAARVVAVYNYTKRPVFLPSFQTQSPRAGAHTTIFDWEKSFP
jgi:hypothetical protein